MPFGTMLFLGGILLLFLVLDGILLLSLLKPGDERNQIIVWKASSFTLFAIVGEKILDIIENFVKAQPMTANPLIQLEVTAVVYFAALMYYKKRYSA